MLASREASAAERGAARRELESFLRSPAAPPPDGAKPPRARTSLQPSPPVASPRPAEPPVAPPASPVAPAPPVAEAKRDPRTGSTIVPSGNAAIDPATGARLIDVGNGWLDPATGRFVPKR